MAKMKYWNGTQWVPLDAADAETLEGLTVSQVRSGTTKTDVGLGNVDNVQQASKTEFDSHLSEEATQTELGHIKLSDIPSPEIATQAEAETGTNNTKFMTPLRTAQALDSRIKIDGDMLEVYMEGEWKYFKHYPLTPGSWGGVQNIV